MHLQQGNSFSSQLKTDISFERMQQFYSQLRMMRAYAPGTSSKSQLGIFCRIQRELRDRSRNFKPIQKITEFKDSVSAVHILDEVTFIISWT